MAPKKDNQMKVSVLPRAGHKVGEVANLAGLAQPFIRSGSAWTMAKVNRRTGSGRKTVVDRDSLHDVIRRILSDSIPQAVTIPNSLSTTAYTSVDTFAIIHALLDRVDGCARYLDKVCKLTHYVSRTKK